jgi:lipoprotein-anchoring transpeptidase ErfK/SrfK
MGGVIRRAVVLAAAIAALAACGDAGTPARPTDSGTVPSIPTTVASPAAAVIPTTARTCVTATRRSTDARSAVVLGILRSTTARRAPHPGAAAIQRLHPRNTYGLRQIVLALSARVGTDCRVRWYRVKLPSRPNGRTGWIPARSLQVETVAARIVADLSARRLTVYRRGLVVARIPMAIGAPGSPTPTGSFYVDSRFRITTPGSAFGPAILGIAAYSEASQGWARGNPIAIHGTSADGSIGAAASHGCLRVHNRDILRLMRLVPAGTPIVIRA